MTEWLAHFTLAIKGQCPVFLLLETPQGARLGVALVAAGSMAPAAFVYWTLVRAQSLQSCPTLCNPVDCSTSGSSVHGIFPAKNTGVGCHALFQGIFPTQGLNQHLLHVLHWRWILYPLSYWENPVTELPGKPWLLNSWLYFSSTSHKGFYYKARLENLRFDNLGCDLRQFLDYRSLG